MKWPVLAAVFVLAGCGGESGSRSYLPAEQGSEWATLYWTEKDAGGTFTVPILWTGTARVVGVHDDIWKVLEVRRDDFVQGTLLLRSDEESLEVLGYAPSAFGGDAAQIQSASSGPLVFHWADASSGYTKTYNLATSGPFGTRNLDLQLKVLRAGESIETESDTFKDGLEIELVSTSDLDGATSRALIALARGVGPVRAFLESFDTHTYGGDIVRR